MTNPNAQSLALRDPAMAAIMGLIAASNFGHEPVFAQDVSERFAPGDEADADYGSEFGADFGAAFGADFGALAQRTHAGRTAHHTPTPTAEQAMQLWHAHHAKLHAENSRSALLEPNKGLSKKIERYNMQVSDTFVFGTPKTFTGLTTRPTVDFRPQVLFMNAPTPMFAFVSAILVANVNTFVGQGEEDAFDYNALGQGKEMDMPTLTPAIPFTVNARYTGFTPPGFLLGSTNTYSVAAKGPASIVA
jgi:hypothetical protein